MSDDELRAVVTQISPKARDALRRTLIRDHADRDALSSRLMRYRDERGDDWADTVPMPAVGLSGVTFLSEGLRDGSSLRASSDGSGSSGTGV